MKNNADNSVVSPETRPTRGNYLWVLEPSRYPPVQAASLERWDPNAFSGILSLTLTTIQPIHVGSGKFVPYGQDLYQEFYRHHQTPVIPGSSLKGVIRHHLITLIGPENAQTLFGSTEQASRVIFSDALPEASVQLKGSEIPERWGPRLNPPPHRVKYYPRKIRPQDLRRRKERLEVVPKGAKFKFIVVFRNLQAFDLGALLVAMGLDPDRRRGFKLGGGKGYGLGLVWLELNHKSSWYTEGVEHLLKSSQERQKIAPEIVKNWVQAFWKAQPKDTKKILQEVEEEFRREYRR